MIQTTPEPITESRATIDRAAYLAGLVNLRASLDEAALLPETLHPLQQIRDRAASRLQELALPSSKDEDWRFTDLSNLLKVSFALAQWHSSDPSIQHADLQPFELPEAFNRLVCINGVFASDLSYRTSNAGAAIGDLAGLQHGEQRDRLFDYLAQQQGSEEVFTTLNTANLKDVAIVWVPRNQEVKRPIHLLFVSTTGESATLSHPRCLIVAEPGSSLTVIEEYVTLGSGTYFTNPVTEIFIAENAAVNHTRVQRDSASAFHIGKTAVSQARDSRYTCHAISLGAQLSRHHLEIYQTGEQTQTTLNGLTLVDSDRVADTHSTLAFSRPYGSARQTHKCIVDDHAHAIFNGRIFVPKLAQLTDAGQLSQNLLLSPKARIDTKPQLEITADNVKCAHGATVSQLEGDEIFYLQSRGIDEESARKLLIYAFANELVSQIPIASLQDTLSRLIQSSTD